MSPLILGNDFCMSYRITLDLVLAKAILQIIGYEHTVNLAHEPHCDTHLIYVTELAV